jgi:hypothetical protein
VPAKSQTPALIQITLHAAVTIRRLADVAEDLPGYSVVCPLESGSKRQGRRPVVLMDEQMQQKPFCNLIMRHPEKPDVNVRGFASQRKAFF